VRFCLALERSKSGSILFSLKGRSKFHRERRAFSQVAFELKKKKKKKKKLAKGRRRTAVAT